MTKKDQYVYTDTPLIDEIVYQIKGMIQEGIVLKSDEDANYHETVDSSRSADMYSDIVEGKTVFEMFTYDYSLLMKLPYMTKDMAILWARNQSMIDDKSKPYLLKLAEQRFLDSYEEKNNYYRMLAGLPDLGKKGLHLTQAQIKKLHIRDFDAGKYIHEISTNEIKILENSGVMEEILETYPDTRYLRHVGEKKIDPYAARKTPNFGLLYLHACESNEVYTKFKDRLEINRVYLMQTIYNDAYRWNSAYYDRFMMILIIINSFLDMVVLSPEYIIQRELFDMRTIQYVFESQGVEFFPEIPLKYQKRLVKNLNRLVKYKASDKCLVDIVSLFGFPNAELFRYYLLKDPVMLEDGTYKKDTYEDPKTGEYKEDLDANYELKFIKVRIPDGVAEEAIRNPFNHIPYENIVSEDIYWNGTYTKEYVKQTILEHEYNMVVSKYIGLEVTYSLTELAMELCYFVNMIVYTDIDKELLQIEVPEVSSTNTFALQDLFIALFALKYIYLGIKDNIIYNPVQALDCYGFNFDVDMDKLAAHVAEKGYTLEELGVAHFQIPESGILTFNQLMEIYTTNTDIYKHLVHEITTANDKDIYDIYRNLWQSLMVTKLNFDYFRSEGIEAETYTEFLTAKNSPLGEIVRGIKLIEKEEERKNEASKIINYIVDNIYIYIDQDMFPNIFHGIPTVSMDYIRQYMFKVLNFFKSYKVDFVNTNIIYKFDDRLDNWINVIDRILMRYIFTKTDRVEVDDYIKEMLITLRPGEIIPILEKIWMDITYWKKFNFKTFYRDGLEDAKTIIDNIAKILVILEPIDYGSPWDDRIATLTHNYQWSEFIRPEMKTQFGIAMIKKDKVEVEDNIYIDRV